MADSNAAPKNATPLTILLGAALIELLAVACLFMFTASRANAALQPDNRSQAIVAALFVILATVLGVMGLAMLIVGSVRWAMDRDSAARSSDDTVVLLNSINDRMLLSETAKRIAYRHDNLQMLRKTIREDIAKSDFDAALALVGELSQTYGYLEEAEVYRDQITAARMAEQEAKLTEAIARLDDILARNDFDLGGREAAKIQRLYPESERAKTLVRRVVQAREQYKHELERQFLAAAERDDVDHAMELLKELDKYLTESEGEPFRETARGVIGKKRDNLGVQFKIAVHDREWLRAVRVGEQIIQDFPNTKMANEVRGMIDLLRERAAGQQAAQVR